MEMRPSPETTAPHVPVWLRRLAVVVLVAGAVVLLFILLRTWRRGGAGLLMAVAVPAVASIATATRPLVEPAVNQHVLKRILTEIATKTPRLTPTELFEQLKAYDLEFGSVQEMARVLSPLGFRSEVDYVSGRSERRWYRFDRWEGA